MVSFRKPIVLKILLLIFIGAIFVHNLALLLKLGVFVKEFSRILIALAGIQIIQYLYSFKINRNILVVSAVCLILLTFNLYTLKNDLKEHNIIFFIRRINRILLSAGILALSLFTYLKMFKSLDDKNLYSKKIEKWIKITIFLFILGILNNLSTLFFSNNLIIIKIISSIVHLTCCFLAIYRPSFINRTELSVSLGRRFRKTIEDQIDAEKFINEFFSKTYYIQKEISIDDLASKLSVPASKLNDFIIETTKMNFIDLVNKNRVEYFISLVRSEKFSDYTIEALSELSGFGSRQSLYRNFKRFHGGSPSDLIRMYE
jgi:AraC-like DNA-binding protein